jgi:hypothetical protein
LQEMNIIIMQIAVISAGVVFSIKKFCSCNTGNGDIKLKGAPPGDMVLRFNYLSKKFILMWAVMPVADDILKERYQNVF